MARSRLLHLIATTHPLSTRGAGPFGPPWTYVILRQAVRQQSRLIPGGRDPDQHGEARSSTHQPRTAAKAATWASHRSRATAALRPRRMRFPSRDPDVLATRLSNPTITGAEEMNPPAMRGRVAPK